MSRTAQERNKALKASSTNSKLGTRTSVNRGSTAVGLSPPVACDVATTVASRTARCLQRTSSTRVRLWTRS
jgi:hypothetical protein